MREHYFDSGGTDAEVIAVLKAISQVSVRMARNKTILVKQRQFKEGEIHHEQNEQYGYDYASYIFEQIEATKETCADPMVLIEQRVDFSRWVEQGFSTADCIIIADGTLRIIDYKHGLGVLVSAEDNPQVKCYALGALELFDDIYDIDNVSMTIYPSSSEHLYL